VIGQRGEIGVIESYIQIPPMLSSVVSSLKFRGACLKLLTIVSDYDDCQLVIIKMNHDFAAAHADGDERILRPASSLEKNLVSTPGKFQCKTVLKYEIWSYDQ
jgi:hypothetical protein